MIYGPFADLIPPRVQFNLVGTTPADDVVAGIVSHIIPWVKSARDFLWALTVALVSLATLLFEVSYCERNTTL